MYLTMASGFDTQTENWEACRRDRKSNNRVDSPIPTTSSSKRSLAEARRLLRPEIQLSLALTFSALV